MSPPFPTYLTTQLSPFYIASLNKRSYVLDTGKLVATVGADRLLVWCKNTHPTMDMIYWSSPQAPSGSSWNGGNTNHNRACFFRARVGTPEPTVDVVARPLYPTNGYNEDPAPASALIWNGAGANGGMTPFDPNADIVPASAWLTQGFTPIGPQGAIIPPGGAVACSFEPEETGVITDLFFFTWKKFNAIF